MKQHKAVETLLVVAVVVINKKTSSALLALTTAALCLPGLELQAATPVAQAEGGTEFGYYQESDQRMQVEMFHANGIVPVNDNIEFNFSLDRDTYAGASPAYNLPANMINQQQYQKTAANGTGYADVISAASSVSAATLASEQYSSLAQTKAYHDAKNAIYSQLTAAVPDPSNLPADVKAEFQKLSTIAGFDAAINGYTPSNTQTVQHFQTQPLETRSQPVLGLKYYFDNTTVGISGGLSDEPDFLSNLGSINLSHEFNDKRTTVFAGYSVTRNAIFRNQAHNHSPPGVDLGHIHPADCTVSACTDYQRLNANSLFNGVNLGFSQVLGKNTLLNVTGTYNNEGGFLNNAYKTVYVRGLLTADDYYNLQNNGNTAVNWKALSPLEIVGPELFRENRPTWRNNFAVNTGLNQFIPALDASLHFDYRFYQDDWQVSAHTFEFKWFQPLGFGITLTPSVRYYSQSQAFYFAPYYLAPRADNFYSSDYRLSAFGALSGGLTLEKKLNKAIKLEAGFEYYKHASSYTLGGGGSGSYADYSYYMAHAGVDVNFSAPGSLFSGDGNVWESLFGAHAGHQHHHHTHFGSLPPAGVMFGHMMNQADDVMVGYLYMLSNQAGHMLKGGQTVSDQAIVANGCPGYTGGDAQHSGCLIKPANMTMGMHMLDVMYAPTDWLNLMLMPQLMDMQMNMSDDLRAPLPFNPNSTWNEVHQSGDTTSFYSQMRHSVFDLGDTIMMPLFKLYDDDMHHFHVGTGISAPTGSVSEVHNTLTTLAIGNVTYNANVKVLQDFGMQSGSGTWDFKPNLTYTGQINDLFWGGQFNATNRLQNRNRSGYALGDVYQGTSWLGYKAFDWLSATVRGIYTQQNKLKGDIGQIDTLAFVAGQTNQIAHNTASPVDYAQNSGGHYWDVGLGVRIAVPSGSFAGHTLSLEWLQPVKDVVDGYQLQRTSGFAANWTYMF